MRDVWAVGPLPDTSPAPKILFEIVNTTGLGSFYKTRLLASRGVTSFIRPVDTRNLIPRFDTQYYNIQGALRKTTSYILRRLELRPLKLDFAD